VLAAEATITETESFGCFCYGAEASWANDNIDVFRETSGIGLSVFEEAIYQQLHIRMVHNKRMTIEERVGGLEARPGKNDALAVELRDAMTATAHMEARQSRALKEHAEWLVEHDKAIIASRQDFEQSLKASRREFDQRIKVLDKRISDLVSAFGASLPQKQ
jgi:hypothetical protein